MARVYRPRVQEQLGLMDLSPFLFPGYQQPWGLLTLPPGGRYRLLLSARGLVNLGLLSAPEQEQVEDAWSALLRSLDFPLQIFVQSRPVGLPEVGASVAAQGMSGYAHAYSRHLALWSNHRIQVRRIFLVVPSEAKREQEAVRELERRVRHLGHGLSRWVTLSVLGPEEVLLVLRSYWRKSRIPEVPPQRWGWDNLVVEGAKLRDVCAVATDATEGSESR